MTVLDDAGVVAGQLIRDELILVSDDKINMEFSVLNELGNAIFGIGMCLGVGTEVLTQYLPFLGFLAAIAHLCSSCGRLSLNNSRSPLENLLISNKLTMAFLLPAYSLISMNLTHNPSLQFLGIMPLFLAMSAFVDLVDAIDKWHHAEGNARSRALIDVTKKAFAFIGWSLLACGHPLGWIFLASTAFIGLIALASKTTYLGGPGLFGRSAGNSLRSNDHQDQPLARAQA